MELLERVSQLDVLDSALNEVKAGEGRIALVYGEAGIGKTSLVEHFTNAYKKTWQILSGACDLLFTPRPLGPLGDIALQTEGRLLSLLNSGSGREAIFSACLTELKNRPTILVIEDIHWADEATLDLLKYLGRRIRQTVCLMILTYRDDEIGSDSPLWLLLGDLASSPVLHRVPVLPLSQVAVRALAGNKSVDAAALHLRTGGNPFFVTEVLAGEGGIPQTVRDAVLSRAARLSNPARGALEAAAVVGARVEPWLLSEISHAVPESIEECMARGLLYVQGDAYAFRHDLARQTILESIGPQRKTELHRKALAALKAYPRTRNDLTRLASHAEGTKDAQAVLKYAPAAARHASAVGAHHQAAALYELTLQFAEALPPARHAQILEAYAEEYQFLGRSESIIAVRQQIVEEYHALGDRLREGLNLSTLAIELHEVGRLSESNEEIEAAISLLEALPPSGELARAYRAQCFLRMHDRAFPDSVASGDKARLLAEQFGDMDTVARACNYAGYGLLLMEDERGRALMEQSLAVGMENGLSWDIGGTLVNWASALVETFRFEGVDGLLKQGIAHTTRHDDDYHLRGILDTQAQMQLYQGQWTEAADRLRQALQQADADMVRRVDEMIVLGRLEVRQGDERARATLDEALRLSAQAIYLSAAARAVRAEAAWLEGDNERAIGEARVAYDRAVNQKESWATGELAFWRWRAGEVFTPPKWIAKPYALQLAGDWRGAAKDWEQRGCPYEQALALMDGDEAAQLAALQIFERIGARRILEKLKQKLRAAGVRSIPRGPTAATRRNQFGLTTREMEVLACLVKGLNNPTIAQKLSLSPRTVEHHIASILQKMGVQTRTQVIALASREGLVPRG